MGFESCSAHRPTDRPTESGREGKAKDPRQRERARPAAGRTQKRARGEQGRRGGSKAKRCRALLKDPEPRPRKGSAPGATPTPQELRFA